MRRTPFANICLLITFLFNSIVTVPIVQAQELVLPKPGVMVHLSSPLNPAMLKGIKVHSDNPFKFDFILDQGDVKNSNDVRQESSCLIKYFLASLTTPEKDLWVNLSPYEKDRIVTDSFGVTEMGRDLLAQDYLLKQVTASLIYPEGETGKKFWKRVYEEAGKKYGTANIPVNTFNKVWIVPDKAVVYENAKAGTAYVVESKLKVMLESDYLSMEKHVGNGLKPFPTDVNQIGSQIVREIVIPELTREVNEGKNFAQLRQVYNSLILATWYKKKIKDSILSKVYADKKKTQGIEFGNSDKGQVVSGKQSELSTYPLPLTPEVIYQNYLQAFKKGVYNYIKEEIDPATQEAAPRKYFSGGFDLAMTSLNARGALQIKDATQADPVMLVNLSPRSTLIKLGVALTVPHKTLSEATKDKAMTIDVSESTQGKKVILRKDAAMTVDSRLNPFAFEGVFTGETQEKQRENTILSLQALVERHEPGLWFEYQRYMRHKADYSPRRVQELKEKIYSLTQSDVLSWRNAPSQSSLTNGYVDVLKLIFSDLKLNAFSFVSKYDGKDDAEKKQNAILSIQGAIERYEPEVWEEYQIYVADPGSFQEERVTRLRGLVYGFNSADFKYWGLSTIFNKTAVPAFNAEYKTALIESFPALHLLEDKFTTRSIKKYDWKNGGKRLVIEVLKEKVREDFPDLYENFERYVLYPQTFSLLELQQLREGFYRIEAKHFSRWGLSGLLRESAVSGLSGSYIDAIIYVFPELDLKRLAFSPQYNKGETVDEREVVAVESVQALIERHQLALWQEYEAYKKDKKSFSKERLHALKEQIYQIAVANLHAWGLGGAISHVARDYFYGKHSVVLAKAFPELELNSYAAYYRLDGESKEDNDVIAIKVVQSRVERYRPDLWEAYQDYRIRQEEFTTDQLQELREMFYQIDTSAFEKFGLVALPKSNRLQSFTGSYAQAFVLSFPKLRLNENAFIRSYSGETVDEGRDNTIRTIHASLERFRLGLWQEYQEYIKAPEKFNAQMLEHLRGEFYKINSFDMNKWKLRRARASESVDFKTYQEAIIESFKELELVADRFERDESRQNQWSWRTSSVKEIFREAIKKYRPGLWRHFEHYLTHRQDYSISDLQALREECYQISAEDIASWGLTRIYDQGGYPTYNDGLMDVFKELDLNFFAFHGVFAGRDNIERESNKIKSVQAAIQRYRLNIWQEYQLYEQDPKAFDADRLIRLKESIYQINSADFSLWHIGVPGSYISALISAFPAFEKNSKQDADAAMASKEELVEQNGDSAQLAEASAKLLALFERLINESSAEAVRIRKLGSPWDHEAEKVEYMNDVFDLLKEHIFGQGLKSSTNVSEIVKQTYKEWGALIDLVADGIYAGRSVKIDDMKKGILNKIWKEYRLEGFSHSEPSTKISADQFDGEWKALLETANKHGQNGTESEEWSDSYSIVAISLSLSKGGAARLIRASSGSWDYQVWYQVDDQSDWIRVDVPGATSIPEARQSLPDLGGVQFHINREVFYGDRVRILDDFQQKGIGSAYFQWRFDYAYKHQLAIQVRALSPYVVRYLIDNQDNPKVDRVHWGPTFNFQDSLSVHEMLFNKDKPMLIFKDKEIYFQLVFFKEGNDKKVEILDKKEEVIQRFDYQDGHEFAFQIEDDAYQVRCSNGYFVELNKNGQGWKALNYTSPFDVTVYMKKSVKVDAAQLSDQAMDSSKEGLVEAAAKALFKERWEVFYPGLLDIAYSAGLSHGKLFENAYTLVGVVAAFGDRLEEFWPELITLGVEAGMHADKLLMQFLPLFASSISSKEQLKTIGETMLNAFRKWGWPDPKQALVLTRAFETYTLLAGHPDELPEIIEDAIKLVRKGYGGSIHDKFTTKGFIRSKEELKHYVSEIESILLRNRAAEFDHVKGVKAAGLTQEQEGRLKALRLEWENSNFTQKHEILDKLAAEYPLSQDFRVIQEFFMFALLDENFMVRRRVTEFIVGIDATIFDNMITEGLPQGKEVLESMFANHALVRTGVPKQILLNPDRRWLRADTTYPADDDTWKLLDLGQDIRTPLHFPPSFLLKHLNEPWISADIYGEQANENAIRNKRLAILTVLERTLAEYGKATGAFREYYNQIKELVIREERSHPTGLLDQDRQEQLIEEIEREAMSKPQLSTLGQHKPMTFWEAVLVENMRFLHGGNYAFLQAFTDKILAQDWGKDSPLPAVGKALATFEERMNMERPDAAMSNTGGIDFNADKLNLQIQNTGEGVGFKMDPAMLQQLQNAPGFTPVIMTVEPMTDLLLFMGISKSDSNSLKSV